jgi:NAD dependent epimerase/dehydratase family enzyme
MSWLHLDDWVGIAKFLMTNPAISAPVNLAAPNPVTNQEFMRCMRKEFAPLGIGFPAPTPAIYLGGLFMGTEPDLVLKSRKLKSAKLESTGYSFSYPYIEQALSALAG